MVHNHPDAPAPAYPPRPEDPGAFRLAFGDHRGRSLAWIAHYHPGYFSWLFLAAYEPLTKEAVHKFALTDAGKKALAQGARHNRKPKPARRPKPRNSDPENDWAWR